MSNVVALREREAPHPGPLPEGEGELPGALLPEVAVDVERLLDAQASDDAVLPEPKKWGKMLLQLVDKQVATFRRMGHDERTARRLAHASVLTLAEHGGGQNWYMPRGDNLRAALRDIDIFRRFRRGNIEALAAEYRLTVPSIYRIYREQRRLSRDKRQGTLPFGGEPANRAE